MNFKAIQPDESIALFVKNILLFEDADTNKDTTLPFFADGYPGLMFQNTQHGLFVEPHHKKMPQYFLYGQTITPIELMIRGNYKLIVFQLYPFILKSFFNLSAISLNDGCYDLQQVEFGKPAIKELLKVEDDIKRIEIITNFLLAIFKSKQQSLDLVIRDAIELILYNKGKIAVREICEAIHLTERTFERRFLKETGISPKQFSGIIRFQQSLEQLTLKEFTKLTDIVYSNGYADQSHFIRVFKAFTGKTPRKFLFKKI